METTTRTEWALCDDLGYYYVKASGGYAESQTTEWDHATRFPTREAALKFAADNGLGLPYSPVTEP